MTMAVQPPAGMEDAFPIRVPCSAEKRCIVRHVYRFYNNIVVAGVYSVSTNTLGADQLCRPETYFPALTVCVKQHPFLSAVVQHVGTKRETYARVRNVDLKQHASILSEHDIFGGVDGVADTSSMNESTLFARAFEYIHKEPTLTYFDALDKLPAWRIVVLPLAFYDGVDKPHCRALIAFTLAHSHGDGMSGLAFHRYFFDAFYDSLKHETTQLQQATPLIETTPADLPSLPHLSVTPLYLLAPALGHYLPTFLKKAFGIRASVSGVDESTWTGTKTFCRPPESGPAAKAAAIDTAVELLSIKCDTVAAALKEGKSHSTKLTALLDGILAHCITHHLPRYATLPTSTKTAVCAISTNIRKAFDVSNDKIGVFGSAAYISHNFQPMLQTKDVTSNDNHNSPIIIDEKFWHKAQQETADLARSSAMKKNQPIGLLNWISNFDTWVREQLDDRRDGSWEISNLGSFDVNKSNSNNTPSNEHGSKHEHDVRIEDIFFTQPANAIGFPLVFDVVSLAGGALNICAGWQIGALGLDPVDGKSVVAVEREFVRCVLKDVEEGFGVVCKRQQG